jgi:hypothetical protein
LLSCMITNTTFSFPFCCLAEHTCEKIKITK